MYKMRILLLLSLAIVALGQEATVEITSRQPSSSVTASSTPPETTTGGNLITAAAPTSTSSAPDPTTTEASAPPSPTSRLTTRTTETTTSEPPETTTRAPPDTTTRAPPDTTTRAPPDTTTKPPQTTNRPPVAPTPPPFPKNVGNWSVVGVRSPCILLMGALQLHVNVTSTGNKTEMITLDVPSSTTKNVHVSGKCKSDVQKVSINWWSTSENASERNNTLIIKFAKQLNEQYGIESFKYTYADNKTVEVVGPFLLTNLKRSYLCKSNQRLQNDNGNSFMLTENLQFEAFRDDGQDPKLTPSQFSTADECKADNRTSTGVVLGIAVGIGLLIIVVISLGIYLFKRCRRGGYQPLDTHS